MTNDFLPEKYEVPSSSDRYMKFVKGENRFRILCSPILGYEWWNEEDGKRMPIRVRMGEGIPTNLVDDPDSIKHFWAMVVWNYQTEKVQILEVTQKGIQKTLRALAKDEDWGSPVMTYDVVVTRNGDGMETKYEVLPKPAKALDKAIVQLYKDTPINLEALFDSKDPFATESVDPKEVEEALEVKV